MQFPFEIKGRVEVPIVSPEKAGQVMQAIRQKLEGGKVIDLRWEDNRLCFRGEPLYYWLLDRSLNRLGNITTGEVSFRSESGKVLIEYHLTFPRWPLVTAFVISLPVIGKGATTDPWCLLFLPVIPFATWFSWLLNKRNFYWYFRLAATRGLADQAERELKWLQSKVVSPYDAN